MIWIVAIIVGAIVGWLAGLAPADRENRNWLMGLIIGIIGALFAVWLLGFGFGFLSSSAGTNFWLSILWSIIGSFVFLAIVETATANYFRRGEYNAVTGRAIPHTYEERREEEDRRRRM